MLGAHAPSRSIIVVLCAAAVAAAIVLSSYSQVFAWLLHAWDSNPDMSHGYIVPVIAVGLLWLRREMRPNLSQGIGGQGMEWWSLGAGLGIVALACAIRCYGIYYRSISLEGISLVPLALGATLGIGGWKALRWTWPSIVFLVFMFPMPLSFGGILSGKLQAVATVASTYLLQLFNVPAVSQGNTIWLTNETVGVAEACNGLRMMTSFCAMTMAACFIFDRPMWQKAIILLSAPLIGIVSNIIRITITGIAYEYGNAELAHKLFHDVAGWLMIPIAMVLLAIEIFVISKLVLPVENADALDRRMPARRKTPSAAVEG